MKALSRNIQGFFLFSSMILIRSSINSHFYENNYLKCLQIANIVISL